MFPFSLYRGAHSHILLQLNIYAFVFPGSRVTSRATWIFHSLLLSLEKGEKLIRESDDAVAVMDLEITIMMMATKSCRKS